MKPLRPTSGIAGSENSVIAENVSETLTGIGKKAGTVLDAVATNQILKGIGGIGSDRTDGLIPAGIGEMLMGMGGLFKGTSEVQVSLMKQLLEGNGNGKGSDEKTLALLAILLPLLANKETKTDGNTEMFLKLMELMDRNHKERLEMETRHHEEREKEWQQRSGPSYIDQVVHDQIIPTLFNDTLKSKNKTLPEQLAELAQLKNSLSGLFGGNGDEEYSEAWLKKMGIQKEILSIEKEHEREMEKLKQKAAAPAEWGKTLGGAAQYASQLLGSLGFGPVMYATPGDNAAAREAMGE